MTDVTMVSGVNYEGLSSRDEVHSSPACDIWPHGAACRIKRCRDDRKWLTGCIIIDVMMASCAMRQAAGQRPGGYEGVNQM